MKIKNIIYAMLCICVAFVISGCGKNTNDTLTPTGSPEVTATVVPTVIPSQSEQITIAPPENFEITIYTLSPDSLEKEAVTNRVF